MSLDQVNSDSYLERGLEDEAVEATVEGLKILSTELSRVTSFQEVASTGSDSDAAIQRFLILQSLAQRAVACLNRYRQLTAQWANDEKLILNMLGNEFPELCDSHNPSFAWLLKTNNGNQFKSLKVLCQRVLEKDI